ncbi:hypothetical protein F8388_013096 [Cannabis sativa]|uniref:Reverse transcriptase zinc-binding domain-containing protein n=1 Tax=Cannabis sativa TaxID=3483 RepID=A0A7J6F5D0_CANSA|nr:hypothetical protein F8388_013096 [Cannabis sativa]KAF4365089.1 hypothetical protein G4B88_018269 [Cannabis sativa]
MDSGSGRRIYCVGLVGLVEWDGEVLADVLTARDQALVWKILLSSHMSSDLWYWLHDASGVFTVKSAYSLLQSMKSNRDIHDSFGFWRLLWQLQLPPKVLNFLWRVSTNSLPTRFHLSIKHIPIAATCPFCLAAPETTLHVLVRCSFAQSCWSKVSITDVAPDAMLFSNWFEAGLASWNTAEALEASMVCWSIWTHRNDLVWNFKHPDAGEVVALAQFNYVDWFNAQKLNVTNKEKRK